MNYIKLFQQGGAMAQQVSPLEQLAQILIAQTDEEQGVQMTQMFAQGVAKQYGEDKVESIAAEVIKLIETDPEQGLQTVMQVIQAAQQAPQMARKGAKLQMLRSLAIGGTVKPGTGTDELKFTKIKKPLLQMTKTKTDIPQDSVPKKKITVEKEDKESIKIEKKGGSMKYKSCHCGCDMIISKNKEGKTIEKCKCGCKKKKK